MKKPATSVQPAKTGPALQLPTPDTSLREGGLAADRCLATLLVVLIALPGLAVRPPEKLPFQPPAIDQYKITAKVDSVVLHPIVYDRQGFLVSGLGKDDFQIREDGVLQQITHFSHQDLPATVGLIIDNSGSMDSKRSEVISAGLAFARSSHPEDEMFVVTFNEHVSFGLPEGMPFTDRAEQLELALSRAPADGMTGLYDAVAAGLEHLKKGKWGKKVLIVVSDGSDNASRRTLAQTMTLAEQSDALIYTIGIFEPNDPDENTGVLKRLARATGGVAYFPPQLRDVALVSEQIARDLRNQYTLAYTPENQKHDGTYRVIRVKASAPGRGRLSVRARAGYFAPSDR